MAHLIVNKELDKAAKQFYNLETLKINLEKIDSEAKLVKKVRDRYSTGKYNLMLTKDGQKGFRQVWYGQIKEESYCRERSNPADQMPSINDEDVVSEDQWTDIE